MTRLSALALAAGVMTGAAAYACPDMNALGQGFTEYGYSLWDRQYLPVTAGGSNSLSACGQIRPVGGTGEGYFTASPDFTISLNEMEGYDLEIRVVSDCDAALLVNSPDGIWFYDDDSNGNLDPAISLSTVPNGYLDIWVGTFDGAYCDATLSLETF